MTDQGSVFVGQKTHEFVDETGFRLVTSTPYYARANGQVEAVNKVIISLINKHVCKNPKNLHKTLDQVLWACRTSPREATDSMPFRLTFGHDAIFPMEICLQAVRVHRQNALQSKQYWNMMFDELDDLDKERLVAIEMLIWKKERVAKVYNRKIKEKTFVDNDYVWKVILLMDHRDRTLGKWSPKWEGPFRVTRTYSNNAYEIKELGGDKRVLRVNGKYLKKYKPMLLEIQIQT
ncbi:uncharacterized protein LOC127103406 [Lathyrus oleraceus]|uniref:uncharacterized protein LOC127103406 n=1 Tax=Pisum sativum TaxID=3888 RepID=UPI0021D2CA77|nr:uncharacterized protein LOC127103406 [Pisum sativum]